jgi:hypothetical protein
MPALPTIGYGNQTLDGFLSLLFQRHVTTLVVVRLHPRSCWNPAYLVQPRRPVSARARKRRLPAPGPHRMGTSPSCHLPDERLRAKRYAASSRSNFMKMLWLRIQPSASTCRFSTAQAVSTALHGSTAKRAKTAKDSSP